MWRHRFLLHIDTILVLVIFLFHLVSVLDVVAKRIAVQEHQLATEVTGVPHYLDFEFGTLLVICKSTCRISKGP